MFHTLTSTLPNYLHLFKRHCCYPKGPTKCWRSVISWRRVTIFKLLRRIWYLYVCFVYVLVYTCPSSFYLNVLLLRVKWWKNWCQEINFRNNAFVCMGWDFEIFTLRPVILWSPLAGNIMLCTCIFIYFVRKKNEWRNKWADNSCKIVFSFFSAFFIAITVPVRE